MTNNAIQIIRETAPFPQVERIDDYSVNFYFDHSSRPYGSATQYSAVMVTVATESDDINVIKSLALPAIKDYRIQQVSIYDSSSNVNEFSLGDIKMWLTVGERQQLATQISANESVGRDSMSKWFGGMEFTFTISEWKQMLVALEVYAGDALNVTNSHKSEIESIDNADEVIAYDITKNYPEKLKF